MGFNSGPFSFNVATSMHENDALADRTTATLSLLSATHKLPRLYYATLLPLKKRLICHFPLSDTVFYEFHFNPSHLSDRSP